MRIFLLQILTLHLSAILFLATPGNAQVKTNTATGNSTPSATAAGQSQLKKTQGANKYQVISCGIQDRKGNLWFGTSGEGVYKYDGKSFVQYNTKDGLQSNSVHAILEDKAGNIWLGTSEGICRFDGNKIIPVPIPYFTRPVLLNKNYYTDENNENTVWSIFQGKDEKIWFGTGDAMYVYDGKNFTRFLADGMIVNKDNLQLKMVTDMLEDNNGNMWFTSGMPPGSEGFCRYDGKTITSFKPNNEGWFRNVVSSKNGNLLLATRRVGILSYDGKTFSSYAQPKDLLKGSLNQILEDRTGKLWVASDYGNNDTDSLGGIWHSNLPTNETDEISFTKITNMQVSFMFEDKDSNIWFGTRGIGLYKFDGKNIIRLSE